MISAELLKILNAELDKELAGIEEEIGTNQTTMLIGLTRCVDHCFVAASYIMPKDKPGYQGWADLFQKYSTGWYVVLKMILPKNDSTVSVMWLNSRQEQITQANAIMSKSGDIGNLKKLLSLANGSDFIETRLEADRTVLFHFSGTDIGVEYLETQQQKWLAETLLTQTDPTDEFENVIMPQMQAGVFSGDGKTISYRPDQVIDGFFHNEGQFYCEALIGFDSFAEQSIFNEIPFGQYRDVMMSLVGNAFRHLHYCFAYQKKTGYGIINPWNSYTLLLSVEEISDMVCKQTGLPEATVSSILQTMILDREGLEVTGFSPGAAPAPLLRISQNKVFFSMMGHLSNPMSYLSRVLVKKFKDDYSVAVNLREEIFKSELYALFDRSLVMIPHNIAIRKDGKLQTDIDALIFDEAGATAFLFQLKWMDDWGTDMAQRSSMLKNYRTSVEKWLDVTDSHIAEKGAATFLRDIGIKTGAKDVTIIKVVLGRHFSRFSNLCLPQNSFFINWAGLVKAVAENPQHGISLKQLSAWLSVNNLSDDLKASPPPVKDVELRLGSYTIITTSETIGT